MSYSFLDKINSPSDIKELSNEEIKSLAGEIREFLIENVEKSGGHLASNLGVVEMTLALHRVFNSPQDKIIFDVGHQAYVHKILTGRKARFGELRVPGGLSGFTNRTESEHDPFGAGHSSTSISAALGYAEANLLSGSDAYTVAVVGDGAFTGGMIHEALNNCREELKLVIILNENRMSISKNKGTYASYLAKVRASERYIKFKRGANSVLKHIPLLGKPILFCLSAIKNKLKHSIYSTNYFEDLGLYYLGPIDGNDFKAMEHALNEAKRLSKCCIIHTYTKKGKGYDAAENAPSSFHSLRSGQGHSTTFHSEMAKALLTVADKDNKVLAVTAAMGIGTGLDAFEKKYPKRYYDVGIAEGHALTFAAGLAAAGYKPYVAIYSTFLQRGYDNIVHDIALQGLPVRMLIDRASLAPSDGATHHGIFDISFLMHIPRISIYSPACYGSLAHYINSSLDINSPVAIRYPDAEQAQKVEELFYPDADFENAGVRANYEETPECVFIAVGCAVQNALGAAEIVKSAGHNVGVVLVEALKCDCDIVGRIKKDILGVRSVLFVEEGIKNGSFSMTAAEKLLAEYKWDPMPTINIAAIDDSFAVPKEKCNLYDYVGLSPSKLAEQMLKQLSEKS